jgi:hypothetical protein
VQKPFSRGATLRITLRGEGRPGELEVVVGGVRAKPLGGYVYEVAAAEIQADPNGEILLEIR